MRAESPPPPGEHWQLHVRAIPPLDVCPVAVDGETSYKRRLQRAWNAFVQKGIETVRPGSRHADR